MSRPAVGDRVTVVRDRLAAQLQEPTTDYTGASGTVTAVHSGPILDRVMVEMDHYGIPMWFSHAELEVLP